MKISNRACDFLWRRHPIWGDEMSWLWLKKTWEIIFCSSKQTFFPFCFPKHFNPNNICFIDFNAKENTADIRQELNILEAKQSSQTLDFGNKHYPKAGNINKLTNYSFYTCNIKHIFSLTNNNPLFWNWRVFC